LLFKQRIPRPDFRKAQVYRWDISKYTFNKIIHIYQFQVVKVEPTTTVVNPVNLSVNNLDRKPQSKAEETKVLPRSILGTINRIRTELDPASEEEVRKSFATLKRTFVSVRLILLLVMFLTQQLSKHFV